MKRGFRLPRKKWSNINLKLSVPHIYQNGTLEFYPKLGNLLNARSLIPVQGKMDSEMNNTLEISLRHAVALSQKQLSSTNDFASSLQQNAFSHLDLISQAQGMMGRITDNGTQHKQAIALAIEGIQIAYHVLSSQLQEASVQRKQLVDECENYLATFVINKDQEQEEFSPEELAIQYYWELVQKECKFFISRPFNLEVQHWL